MCILRFSHFIAHLKEISSKIATKTSLVYSPFSSNLCLRLLFAIYFKLQIIHHNSLLAIYIFRFWVHFTRISLSLSFGFRLIHTVNHSLSFFCAFTLQFSALAYIALLHCSSQFFHISNQFYCNLLVQWIFDHFCIISFRFPFSFSVRGFHFVVWTCMSVVNLVNILIWFDLLFYLCQHLQSTISFLHFPCIERERDTDRRASIWRRNIESSNNRAEYHQWQWK